MDRGAKEEESGNAQVGRIFEGMVRNHLRRYRTVPRSWVTMHEGQDLIVFIMRNLKCIPVQTVGDGGYGQDR